MSAPVRRTIRLVPDPGRLLVAQLQLVEYEDAAVYARASGHLELLDCLLTMAEVEWEHEQYFRARITGHPLLRLVPLWPAPPPRETIRDRFEGEGPTAREAVAEVVR